MRLTANTTKSRFDLSCANEDINLSKVLQKRTFKYIKHLNFSSLVVSEGCHINKIKVFARP